jgi:N-acyl-D-glutamate deacylase
VFFADPAFPKRTGGDYSSIESLASGYRFADRADVLAAQAEDPGALVLWHFLDVAANDRHRQLLDVSVLYPGGAIASDAVPWLLSDGSTYLGDAWPLPDDVISHPRSCGTFTRFLREWVRERKALTLIEGIRKCTLIPAQILESSTPAMARKGRLQVGCDADIVCFDPDSLTDRADFRNPNRPSEGVRHLFVNGEPVIEDGSLLLDARPGRPVRRPVNT